MIQVEHVQPELRSFSAVAGPDPEDVAFTVHGDPDRHVERLVRDLAVADLDHDRVDERHRVHLVQGPVQPLRHLLQHPVADPADGVLGDAGAVHLGEMGANLPSGQTPRRQRQHDPVDPFQAPFPLRHDHRLERAGPVPRHLPADRPDLGQDRLRRVPLREFPEWWPAGSCGP